MKSPTPKQIKCAREKLGLTQIQAGAIIGAPLRTWQDWEYGKRTMPPPKWELWLIKVKEK